jgi:hypothetical protein
MGFALRLSCDKSTAPGDIVSPGFSSLSSSIANPVAVFDFQSVWEFQNIEKVGCCMTLVADLDLSLVQLMVLRLEGNESTKSCLQEYWQN